MTKRFDKKEIDHAEEVKSTYYDQMGTHRSPLIVIRVWPQCRYGVSPRIMIILLALFKDNQMKSV